MSSVAARSAHGRLEPVPRARDDGPARELLREAERRMAAAHLEQKPKGKDRRGPFRPERLVPLRSRLSGAGAATALRRIDAVIIWALSLAGYAVTAPSLLAAPVAHLLPFVIGAATATWSMKATEAYGFGPRESLSGHLLKVAAAFAFLAAFGGAAALLFRPASGFTTAGAIWLATCFSVLYLGHAAWWRLVAHWRAEGKLTPNIVVVGATKNAERLIEALLESREANVLGVFDDRLDRVPDALCGVPVLGGTEALLGHRVMPFVDRVVIAVPASAQGRVRQLIERLRVLPNDISLFLEFGGASSLSKLADSSLAQVSGRPQDEARARAKRVQDLVIGGVALLIALPIMAITALAVRLESPGPVLFRQRRHGFNNEAITVWKFRSMRHESADATAARQVTADDERITRVGRFIRKTSLDELPQIFNVLKGEMSLVGPRPHAIGMKTGDTESARLVAEYAHRHRIKPGVTGWAAINGSRGPVHTPEDVRRRVALDVEYIERQSLWLDLYIMAMTLPCLLGDRSAVR